MRYGFGARLRALVAACVVVAASLLVLAGEAGATTFNAANTAQLEEAVSKANASAGANTIVLAGFDYLPTKTLAFTNTTGVQTVEGPSALPTAKIEGSDVKPEPSELFLVNANVSVTLKNVEITHGEATTAALEDFGTLAVESSTVSGGSAVGVHVESGGTGTVRNSTISDGSAFGLVDHGTASFFNSTVAFNESGGIENSGTLSLTNTIVADNPGGDCAGKANTSDHSLDSDGSCGVGTLSKTNPLLQTGLLNNGGSTPLHSLKPLSPAISAGNAATCTATDQRGFPRPGIPGKPCSIGADEFSETPPAIKVPPEIRTAANGVEGSVVTYSAQASDSDVVRSFSCTPASGSTFPVGTTTVTCTAKDGHENTSTASFSVSVFSCPTEGFCTSFGPIGEFLEGKLNTPEAVAVDSSGNIWVTDSSRNQVLEFNSERKFLRQFGSEGTAEGQFKGIRGIAVNAEGDVYVVDSGNDRVQEFSPTGVFVRKFGSAGTGTGQFSFPTAIAVDSGGNVWVLNGAGVLLQKFSPTGEYQSGFGSKSLYEVETGLAISGGNLYVTGQVSGRVREYSPTTGELVRTFDERGSGAGKSSEPSAIATNPKTGNIYVTDIGNGNVQEFSPLGTFIVAFGSPGSGAGQLSVPRGVALSSTGRIYIADTGNNRVEEWTAPKSEGEPPTYSGSFGPTGEFLEGKFNAPEAVAVDSSGNIWVTDSSRNQVLEFNSERQFLRQFGSEGTAEGQFKGIRGIAVNAEGDVYVVDSGNDRVQEFSPTGVFVRKFGSAGTGTGQFSFPTAIAVDSAGNVWVLNGAGVLLQKFSSTGEYQSGFGSKSLYEVETGLAISGGNLYVTGQVSGRVREYSPTTGELVRTFDERGSGAGKSSEPSAIATNPKTGNLYVTDIGNDNVQEFSASGTFIAAFGSPGSGAGQLWVPRGVALSSTGRIYIADTGNNRVEEWRGL